ncbi:MAG: carbon-nitrogen hydrolase family protein [Proteobacteria bacterium]|nr:carbon-nitrogen hydrolase family protein [Pseudomonadota bacterium]MBU1418171.1 carbon-nitrogen hydrolase family protein [Pseudomonadota bacterium]
MSTNNIKQLQRCNDGTPQYNKKVQESYRKLQLRLSIYEQLPQRGRGIRLGIYQAEADCGTDATEKNMQRLEAAVKQAKKFDTQLLTFPELYVPGYTLDPASARSVCEYQDGPSISRARQIARENSIGLIVPYGEQYDAPGGKSYFFDSIAIISEQGELLDSYRKTHLYAQQERDNWDFGDSDFPVHNIHGFPVGILNCYECEFPELVRILALNGAKLVVGPTAADTYYRMPNGERSKVPYPDVSRVQFPAHAMANNLFFAYCNRTGFESRDGDSWHYRGNSIVYGPHGDEVIAARHQQDTLLIADCVPDYYGRTHPEPDFFYLKDRRPELYQQLVAKQAKFVDISGDKVEEEEDYFSGNFCYPDSRKDNTD